MARMRAGSFANANASLGNARRIIADSRQIISPRLPAPTAATSSASARPIVVADARRYIGGNPTGRGSLWCARFMNMVLQQTGYRGTGSDLARSFAHYGPRLSGPQVGAIAVMGPGAAAAMSASLPASTRREIRL